MGLSPTLFTCTTHMSVLHTYLYCTLYLLYKGTHVYFTIVIYNTIDAVFLTWYQSHLPVAMVSKLPHSSWPSSILDGSKLILMLRLDQVTPSLLLFIKITSVNLSMYWLIQMSAKIIFGQKLYNFSCFFYTQLGFEQFNHWMWCVKYYRNHT